MGILGTITGFLSGGDTLKQVGGIIDDLHMSGEEKAEAKQKLETIKTMTLRMKKIFIKQYLR